MAVLKYKDSNGQWQSLPNVMVNQINVVQTTGTSTTDVMSQNAVTENLHSHTNKANLDSITGNVGTMAYENASSYSSATEVGTALNGKSDTGHTHIASDVTDLGTILSGKLDASAYTLSVVSAVTVSSDLYNVTCPASITDTSNNGAQAVVIYQNGGTTTDYTITVSTTYKSPDGQQISLTCPKNGYCEINYLNIGGTIYARGA